MPPSRTGLHADLTEKILGAFFDVYNALGHGFREAVYERALALALGDRTLAVAQQVPITVWFHGRAVGTFRADLVVQGLVLLELKALPTLEPSHVAQVLNALRATGIEVGLLLNFGPKPQIKRLAMTARPHPSRPLAPSDGERQEPPGVGPDGAADHADGRR